MPKTQRTAGAIKEPSSGTELGWRIGQALPERRPHWSFSPSADASNRRRNARAASAIALLRKAVSLAA